MNGQESINTSSKWCNAYSSARRVPGTFVPVNSQGFHCRVWSAKCTWSSFDISALLSQRMPKITSFKERNANCKPTWTDHLSTCLFQTVHFSSQVLPFTIPSTSHLHLSPVHILPSMIMFLTFWGPSLVGYSEQLNKVLRKTGADSRAKTGRGSNQAPRFVCSLWPSTSSPTFSPLVM